MVSVEHISKLNLRVKKRFPSSLFLSRSISTFASSSVSKIFAMRLGTAERQSTIRSEEGRAGRRLWTGPDSVVTSGVVCVGSPRGTLSGMSDATPTVDVSAQPRRFRRLRIFVSVFFAALTVLLLVFWVRSYYSCDVVTIVAQSRFVHLCSAVGLVAVQQSDHPITLDEMSGGRTLASFPLGDDGILFKPLSTFLGFSWDQTDGLLMTVPWWFLTLVCTLLMAAPRSNVLTIKFSLRSLLIASTLVAVLLGLAMWLAL